MTHREERHVKPCIGLFGTCGNSTWRSRFEGTYRSKDIPFYNPQVRNWSPDNARTESDHLRNDQLVLIPVTAETYGISSLAEVGFSLIDAVRSNNARHFIIYIEQHLEPELMNDSVLAAESLRARALAAEHLHTMKLPNVQIVDSLEHMLSASLIAWGAQVQTPTMDVPRLT